MGRLRHGRSIFGSVTTLSVSLGPHGCWHIKSWYAPCVAMMLSIAQMGKWEKHREAIVQTKGKSGGVNIKCLHAEHHTMVITAGVCSPR